GSDLATVTEAGFAPVRLEHLLELAELPELPDAVMAQQLKLACTRADAPAPSVEAILHALIPARYVDHTHADALLSITNTPHGRSFRHRRVRRSGRHRRLCHARVRAGTQVRC